ncbi:hypothetical protein KC901_03555 [Patescibacteria group bacterium]|nr:hypothetical protein [Patescibacteria group bacterium]
MKNLILTITLLLGCWAQAQETIVLYGEPTRAKVMAAGMNYYIQDPANGLDPASRAVVADDAKAFGRNGKEVRLSYKGFAKNVFVSNTLHNQMHGSTSNVSVSDIMNKYCVVQRDAILAMLSLLPKQQIVEDGFKLKKFEEGIGTGDGYIEQNRQRWEDGSSKPEPEPEVVYIDCTGTQEFKDWKEWVYAYQNHKSIYVDGQIVRQKYRFLERQYEFLRKTDCGAIYVMPNRNSDGKVVVAGLIGFGAGVLVGKEFSKEKVVYRNNPITQPNPTRPTTTADNPPVGPIPGNKTISGRNTTRVVLAGRNPISVRKKG